MNRNAFAMQWQAPLAGSATMARQLFKIGVGAGDDVMMSTRRGDDWHLTGDDARTVMAGLRLHPTHKPRTFCYGREIGGRIKLEMDGEVPREWWPEW